VPRSLLFWLHIVAGVLLAVGVYGLEEEDVGDVLVQAIAVPLLVLTGFLTWLGRRRRPGHEPQGPPPP
jgi:hypothetical protein